MTIGIAFENLMLAIESSRGVAELAPTYFLNLQGTLTPDQGKYEPEHGFGTLAAKYQDKVTRKWANFEATGALDTALAHVLMGMLYRGGVTPTVPGVATAQSWEFIRNINSDDILTATIWFGDPNVQMFQSTYLFITEATFSSSAQEDDGFNVSISGRARAMEKVANPTPPAIVLGELITGTRSDVWIDEIGVNPIGTTPYLDRVVSMEHIVRSNVTEKFFAAGAGNTTKTFSATGRERGVGIETRLVLELPDMTQFDQYDAATQLAVRVKHNADEVIAGETDIYHSMIFDAYGDFEGFSWGTNANSNRVMELTVMGKYEPTIASDARVEVINEETAYN